eukprot:SAG11_NODE_399_length_9764_cov_8.760993_1_plen_148_part_10
MNARCAAGRAGRPLKFSFFKRRHHCRRCGEIFCDACSVRPISLQSTEKAHTAAPFAAPPRERGGEKTRETAYGRRAFPCPVPQRLRKPPSPPTEGGRDGRGRGRVAGGARRHRRLRLGGAAPRLRRLRRKPARDSGGGGGGGGGGGRA